MKIFYFVVCLLLSANGTASELFNESEFGISVANGNTENKNYNIKQSNTFNSDLSTYKFMGRFLNAFSQGRENARYLAANLRYERSLNGRVSLFVGQGLESDKFAGYDRRHHSDIGAIYHFYKERPLIWFLEAGYRYTNEKRLNGSHDYQNSLRGYTEFEKFWNEAFSTKYTLEYVPQLSESKDYLINTELSVTATLTEVFSLRSGYLLRYDNLPAPSAGTKTDTLLSTALVAKF